MKSELIRVGIVHNGEASSSVLSRAVQIALSENLPVAAVITFLQALFSLSQPVGVSQVMEMASSIKLQPERIVEQLFSSQINSSIAEHVVFSKTVLKLHAGQNIIVCNGKVGALPIKHRELQPCRSVVQLIGPLSEGEVFGEEDWSMMTGRESQAYATSLVAMVDTLKINQLSPDDDTSNYRSDLVMKLASLLRNRPKRNRLTKMPELLNKHRSV